MGARKEFVVYLSSTLADLEAERELALKVIAEVGVVRTSYRADEQGAVAACTGDVAASALYVGILGQRYGYVPPAAEGNPADKSITELEYEACEAPGRPKIPRLMFVKPVAAGIREEHVDALSRPETALRMKAFLARANSEQIAYPFRNLDDLRAELRIRVREQADRFHRAESGERTMFGGGEVWKRQLAPVLLACVPGTDETRRSALAQHGGARIGAFELSPDDTKYLATLDAALGRCQLAALLVTPASLTRLHNGVRPEMVGAALAMLRDRCGQAVIVAEGVGAAELPPQWAQATLVELPAGALAGAEAAGTIAALYDRLRALEDRLTLEPRLALPYVVIAPTLHQALTLSDPAGDAFAAFKSAAARTLRRGEFDRIAAASRRLDQGWPGDVYGAQRHEWKCFGAASPSADEIVRRAISRINDAPSGARERRFLKTARLIPRRYRLDEYLRDRWGSRAAIEAVRDGGCLFVVDELALLHPELREAADALLTGARSAVVAVSPCDPAHTRIDELLEELSFLRVGTLVSRFKTDLDPRCEIALNSIDRVDRWLRTTLPELVASAEDQESDPGLLQRMLKELA